MDKKKKITPFPIENDEIIFQFRINDKLYGCMILIPDIADDEAWKILYSNLRDAAMSIHHSALMNKLGLEEKQKEGWALSEKEATLIREYYPS